MIKLGRLIIMAVMLAFMTGMVSQAASESCEDKARQPLVNKSYSGVSRYSFFIDKEPPYQFSQDRYAHEQFSLNNQITVHIEHRGCPFPNKNHVHVEFTLPGKFKSYEETQFWVSKALALLDSLKICRAESTANWCDRLKRAQTEKLEYRVDSSAPYNEGIWLSLEEDAAHNEIFLVLKVDKYEDYVVFDIGTAFVDYDG